jgi:beta-aspartyl-peptidase (threonine type)
MQGEVNMHALPGLILAAVISIMVTAAWAEPTSAPVKPVLVIHGGAGVRPEKVPPAQEGKYRAELERALHTGYEILARGGSSVDAVEAAIKVMEDSPLFNAGKGAVFTRDGRNELDAAIMEGKTKRAGAVAGLTRIKNPISAARAVLDKSDHVLLVGEGADRFAAGVGLEVVSPTYFWTPERWQELQEDMEKARKRREQGLAELPSWSMGTVGAVALDQNGNLAAGTSTGGMSMKRPGRVGDSPLIGAGTYADDICAVSATGHGEVFIRYAVAHDIAARMKYKGAPLARAAEDTLEQLPVEKNGAGGLIALDREGHFAAPFNTKGMFRGHIVDGTPHVAIWHEQR